MVVGAGLLATPHQALAAIDAGAHFVMSSQYATEIDQVCRRRGALYVPGVSTLHAARRLLEIEVRAVSFFPARRLGEADLVQISQRCAPLCVVTMGGVAAQHLHAYARAGAAAVVVRGVLSAATRWRMHAAIVEMRRLRAMWAKAQLEEQPPDAWTEDARGHAQTA